MHKEILTKEQTELLPLVKLFSKNFGLVGGHGHCSSSWSPPVGGF